MTYVSSITDGLTTTENSFRYTYDNKGNITAVYNTTVLPESLAARYTYDEANQLVREDNAQLNKTVTYLYDKGGNIVTKTEYPFTLSTPGTATDTVAYTYDSTWKDLMASYDGTTIDYDEIGNPIDYTHDRYFIWCGRELWSAETEDGTWLELRYDQNGLRSFKEADDQMFHYFWSDDNRLLGFTFYTYGANPDEYSAAVLYDSDNAPIGFALDEMTYYYIKNIQGDVLCVVDETGAPVLYYTYDAWGQFTVTPAAGASNQEVLLVASLNPVTYRGYYYDTHLGLYYLQSRYYDPETGRFINADVYYDTATGIVGTNVFGYCLNDPIGSIDFDGYYNRDNAIKYANRWTRTNKNLRIFNPLFHYYWNGDCANFVSQCLYYGGIKQTDTWYSRGVWGRKGVSKAWRLVSDHRSYFIQDDYCSSISFVMFYDTDSEEDIRSRLKSMSKNLQVGDILYMDLRRDDKTEYKHAAIISAIQDGEIYYAAHTSNCNKRNLTTIAYMNGISKVCFIKIRNDAK